MGIGQFIGDTFQGHIRTDFRIDGAKLRWNANFAGGSYFHITVDDNQDSIDRFRMYGYMSDGVNGEPRYGPETKPASTSAYFCIKY
jgi:hypothetical protein